MKDEYYLDPRVAESYDAENMGLDGDVDFYCRLALESAAMGLSVLELGCGTGRVSIPVARTGVNVVGLERSPAMLAVARSKGSGLHNLKWVEGDMAAFDLSERFGLVCIPFRSFLHLTTVAEQKSCLASVRRHLGPGGRLALNFFNPSPLLSAGGPGLKRRAREGVRHSLAEGGRSRTVWLTEGRVTTTGKVDEARLSDDGAVISRLYRNMRLRYVFRQEMEHLLALHSFAVEALYGGFKGELFTDQSPEMVWIARLRG